MNNDDKFFYNLCKTVSERSTCLSRQIGSVLVKNNSVVSIGWNGPPYGVPRCGVRHHFDQAIRNEFLKKGVLTYKDFEIFNAQGGRENSQITYNYQTKVFDQCPRRLLKFKSGEGLEWCLSGNTKIKLLNGTSETIENLSKENVPRWIYSIDIETGEIVPARALNFRKTGIKNNIVEIELDNGKKIVSTSDHLFLLRNGNYKKAEDLKTNERLMPLYWKFYDGYEHINNYGFGNFTINRGICSTLSIQTEELVYRFISKDNRVFGNEWVIHHKDGNKRNNEPFNLELISRKDHSSLHIKNLSKETLSLGGRNCIKSRKQDPGKFRKECSLGGTLSMTSNWEKDSFRKYMQKTLRENGKNTALLTNSDPDIIRKRSIGKVINGIINLVNISKEDVNEDNYKDLTKKYKVSNKSKQKGCQIPKEETILKYFSSVGEAISIAKSNHKVVSVKKLSISIPVYDLEVPTFHNFAIDLGDGSGIFSHNCVAGHSERNALINAARNGISTKGTTLYMSCGIPCSPCLVEIINAGVKEIVVTKLNDWYDSSSEYLLKNSGLEYRLFDCEID